MLCRKAISEHKFIALLCINPFKELLEIVAITVTMGNPT